MNLDQFLNLVKNPEKAGECATSDLEDLINQYPYFSIARVLHLKNLKAIGSLHFKRNLKITAAHVPDRARLQRYILSEVDTNTLVDFEIPEKQEVVLSEDTSTVEFTPEAIEPLAVEKVEELELTSVPEIQEYKEEVSAAEEIIIENIEEEVVENAPLPELEESLAKISEEISVNILEMKTEIEMLEDISIIADPDISLDESQLVDNSKNETEKHNRLEWFSKYSKREKKPKIDVEKAKKQDADFLDLHLDRAAAAASFSLENEFEQETTIGLKDFVEKLREEGEAFQALKPLLGSQVSETLARVFEKQEMISDAIQVYQQLGLMYPEKIVYFANQIKELKARHNIG